MSKEREKMVIGVFTDHSRAAEAYDRLRLRGYSDSEIHVLMSDTTRAAYQERFPESTQGEHPTGTHATEGMGVGGAIGTVTGAALAAVAAVGTSLVIPGLNLVIAGPLAAALAGAGAGAATGGLVGALVGYGIPESNAEAYEAALKEGGIVLGVEPHSDDVDDLKQTFKDLDGDNICYC